jgi:hypothetical protein
VITPKNKMKPTLKCLALAILILSSSTLCVSQQEKKEQPIQEVFQSELVYPQEKGELQLTFSSTMSRSTSARLFQTPLTIEYGLTDKWQVEFEWNANSYRHEFENDERTRGIGDVRFGTKYSFMNIKNSDFHAAVGLEVGLPTANLKKELTEGFIEYEPFVIVARDFKRLRGTQVFAQAGVGFLQRVKRHEDADENEVGAHEFSLNVGAFVPLKRVAITGELNWQTNRWNHSGEESDFFATPGIVYRLGEGWEMGIGFPIGITTGSDRTRTIFKLVREF